MLRCLPGSTCFQLRCHCRCAVWSLLVCSAKRCCASGSFPRKPSRSSTSDSCSSHIGMLIVMMLQTSLGPASGPPSFPQFSVAAARNPGLLRRYRTSKRLWEGAVQRQPQTHAVTHDNLAGSFPLLPLIRRALSSRWFRDEEAQFHQAPRKNPQSPFTRIDTHA